MAQHFMEVMNLTEFLHYFPSQATMKLFKMFWVGVDLNYEVCSNQISCYPKNMCHSHGL